MQRKKRVEEYVLHYWNQEKNEKQRTGVTAEMTAEALHIWRSDASRELNSLVREGILDKTDTYPVCFYPKEKNLSVTEQNQKRLEPFTAIIGHEGSLKSQIQTARAAAAYPPYGLNIFIIGESGVGKTMLAEEIWRYVCCLRKDSTVPFVSYNCAEHADNPQLLLSHLFGHKKGTFTGADQDKSGIVELADKGILFLDEIHRLPITGQEMLFTVMDRGAFTPLGGVQEKKVHLMLIGATTMAVDAAVLDTFKRRMPILLRIPSLKERPLSERFSLVRLFFSRESEKLGIPIYIEKEAVRYLIAFESKTNIGDLKNEIQICCARGYLRYIEHQNVNQKDAIFVQKQDLSRDIVLDQSRETPVEEFINRRIFGENICITAQKTELNPNSKKHGKNANGENKERTLPESVSPDVWKFARQLVETAEMELVEEYGDKAAQAVAYSLEEICSFAHQGEVPDFLDMSYSLADIQDGKEGTFMVSIRPMIEEHFHIKLMDSEVLLLASILRQYADGFDREAVRKSRFGLILASFEKEQAVQMTKNINRIFGAKLAYPAQVKANVQKEAKLEEILEAVAKLSDTRGIIILTEDKALVHDKRYIEKHSGIVCYIIPKMSRRISIEIAKTMLVANDGQELRTIFNRGRWSGSLEKFVNIFIGKKE